MLILFWPAIQTSEICNFGKDKIFIVSAKNNYRKIEIDFLNNISSKRLIVISEEKVYNLERPKNRLAATDGIPDRIVLFQGSALFLTSKIYKVI